MMRVTSIAAIVILFSFLLGLSLAAGAEEQLGKQLYDKYCLKCHGADGKADTKIGKLIKTPDLNERPWKHGETLASLVKLIKEGEGKENERRGDHCGCPVHIGPFQHQRELGLPDPPFQERSYC